MQELIKELKKHVIEQSNNINFIHHKWFVKYHLKIVEKISLELCDLYPKADINLVIILVWLHDYGKIIDFDNKYEASLITGKQKMKEIGFSKQIIQKTISYINIIDKKIGIDEENTPIEIKIISSADGASHLVGPFFHIWFYENPNVNLEQLMDNSRKKLTKDWDKKIVLPEIKKAFAERYKIVFEQKGIFPKNYLT